MRLTRRLLLLQTVVCIALFGIANQASGQLWSPPVSEEGWNTATNWTPNTVPVATATFDVSNSAQINVSATAAVDTLHFTAAAPAYNFTLSDSTVIFELSGTGIINDSLTTVPTFNAGDGSLVFGGNSTAANAIINTNDGFTLFTGTSTGGQAQIINEVGGTLDISNLTATAMSAGSIEGGGTFLLGSKILTVGSNNLNTIVSGTIADGGSNGGLGAVLTKVGTGVMVLTGVNTYSGGTTINGGRISVASDANLGTGSLIMNGGELEITTTDSSFTSNKQITLLASGGTIAVDAGGSNWNGAISGAGSLTIDGPGTLTVTGENTYTGGTTINGAILATLNDLSLGTGALAIVNGGTLEILGGGVTSADAISVSQAAGGSTIQTDIGTITTLSGPISGSGSLTTINGTLNKSGPGTLILTGVNTYGGYTDVTGGTLIVGSANALSPNAGLEVFAIADLNGFNSTVAALGGNGTITNNGLNPVTLTVQGLSSSDPSTDFFGTLADGVSKIELTVTGPVSLILSGASSYSGGTNITDGALVISTTANGLGTGQIRLDNATLLLGSALQTITAPQPILLNPGGGTLEVQFLENLTLTGFLNGSGTLTEFGLGTLVLTDVNQYSGGTNIELGTVAVSTDANLGTGSLLLDRGTLEALAGITSSKPITLGAGGGTFLADASTSSTLSGPINGAGGFTKEGPGTLVLAGVSSYGGPTDVAEGTLKAGSPMALSPNSAFTVNSILDLNGFSNAVGSLAGTGGVTNNGAAAAALTAGGNNLRTIFSGTLSDGVGVLKLTKTGTEILTLSGTNTYSGATLVATGVLGAGSAHAFSPASAFTVNGVLDLGGNSNTIGSLTGNGQVTSNGLEIGPLIASKGPVTNLSQAAARLSVGANNASTVFNGNIIDGLGTIGLTKIGSGTLVLTGDNTYSGGTLVSSGTLTVAGPQALGLGNVTVDGGVLTADPRTINVRGNYVQNAGGTLQLQIAGASPGQYDNLAVTGNASLNGTLQLVSLGFQPRAGNELTLVSASGSVAGQFAKVADPFGPGHGFNTVEVVYEPKQVLLVFLNLSGPPGPPPIIPISISVPEISPGDLTAVYDIGFADALIGRLTLEDRLDALRAGCTGFSSNMKLNGATTSAGGKEALDGKTPALAEPVLEPGCQNRWGVWVTGAGDFASVEGDANNRGFDFTTGSATVGLDYRLTDHLAIGLMGEYAHTWTGLQPGHIDVDTGRGGLYGTWYNHGIYLNGGVFGGHNTYETSRANVEGLSTGSTEGAEWSGFLGAGYDRHLGAFSVGPIASLQYTSVNLDGFSERGSLAPLAIHSQSIESLTSDVGLRASYQLAIGKVLVEPSLRATWEHEYKYSAIPITAGFAEFSAPALTFSGPQIGQDSAVISAGIIVQLTATLSTYLHYDGQVGREHYSSNAVTGGFSWAF
jgi:fibronectin-binding autotransporter adhesin